LKNATLDKCRNNRSGRLYHTASAAYDNALNLLTHLIN